MVASAAADIGIDPAASVYSSAASARVLRNIPVKPRGARGNRSDTISAAEVKVPRFSPRGNGGYCWSCGAAWLGIGPRSLRGVKRDADSVKAVDDLPVHNGHTINIRDETSLLLAMSIGVAIEFDFED